MSIITPEMIEAGGKGVLPLVSEMNCCIPACKPCVEHAERLARACLESALPLILERAAKVPEEIADELSNYKLVVGNPTKDARSWLQESVRRIRSLQTKESG